MNIYIYIFLPFLTTSQSESVSSTLSRCCESEDSRITNQLLSCRLTAMMHPLAAMTTNPSPPLEVAAEPEDDYYATNDEHEHSLSERIVHYVGGYVQREHWVACKATLAFHAGAITSKSVVTNKASTEQYCLTTYNSLVGSLDSSFFTDDARAFFLHLFKRKDQPMTAHALYRYYNDSRSKMRSVIIPCLPAKLTMLP
jgi:hypothetical protein